MKISSLAIIVLLLVSWVLYEKRQLTQRKQQLISTPEATPVQQLDPKPQLPKKMPTEVHDRGLLHSPEADNAPQPAPEWSNVSKKISPTKIDTSFLDAEFQTTLQQENILRKP
tara:strand:- start:291 stop:629 length:339 start_codon:yes stop_codon:yes gene_type:complete